MKAIKHGLEECPLSIVRPAGERPPRVQAATVDGDQGACLREAAAGRDDECSRGLD